ncbi:MAG TPA: PilZ domain-containing protein [Gemmataceae bacterium]|jgi:hypothetical protein
MSRSAIEVRGEPVAAADKRERRASVRLQSGAKGSCQSLSKQRELGWEAIVRDISCTGIGLLLPRRFEPGTLLAVEIAEETNEQKRLFVARVVRTSRQSEGGWLIGCRLASSLTEDELPLLLDNIP